MFTFTIKLTDIPNIQDDSYTLHNLLQKSQLVTLASGNNNNQKKNTK